MRALCYAQTNIGSGRDNNEDNYYCNGTFKRDPAIPVAEAAAEQESRRLIYGVFDGMGGEANGEQAALLCARRGDQFITMADFEEAEIKVLAGPEKRSRVVPEHERKLTAYHEAGHAVVMHALPDQDPVTQITIVPRGQAGGMTISLPEEDRSYLSRRYMEDQIVGLLGGRVAEKLCLGDISTGASNDIQRASQIARKMVATYGMSDRIGTVAFESGHDEVFIGRTMTQGRSYSEAVAAQIDQEVQRLVADAYDRCERILNDNRDKLEAVASYLLEHETMSGEAFEKVFNGEEAQAPEKVVEVDYNARYTHQPEEEVRNTPSHTEEIPPEGKHADDPMDHI
mgnify:CR=1 FL=1